MATTWFKRLENRSQSTIKLLNIEDPNSRGHNIEVLPGTHIALDMKIPWAPFSGDFPSKHLELQLNGVTRYWIWQATQVDGDFIRFSTNGAWKNAGDHVYGYAGSANNLFEIIGDWNLEGLAQFFLTDRVLTVLDSHFETIPIQPKQFGQAQHTFIKRLENRSTLPLTLFSTLVPQTVSIGPGASATVDMEVTVRAVDTRTGLPVNGRVKINGVDVAATNTQFSTIFRPRPVGAEGELVMPEVSVTAFGYRSTLVDTGF